eukprot:1890673-Prorocentrum_lima.AAC.1
MDWIKMTKDQIMIALVKLAQQRVYPCASTRFNIIPNGSLDVATPRSILLGVYTIRGCGVTKATSNNEMMEGIHALARLDDA